MRATGLIKVAGEFVSVDIDVPAEWEQKLTRGSIGFSTGVGSASAADPDGAIWAIKKAEKPQWMSAGIVCPDCHSETVVENGSCIPVSCTACHKWYGTGRVPTLRLRV